MSHINGISECIVHGPLTAAITGTSISSRFSSICMPYQASSLCHTWGGVQPGAIAGAAPEPSAAFLARKPQSAL
jgi:hypothetical protein